MPETTTMTNTTTWDSIQENLSAGCRKQNRNPVSPPKRTPDYREQLDKKNPVDRVKVFSQVNFKQNARLFLIERVLATPKTYLKLSWI